MEILGDNADRVQVGRPLQQNYPIALEQVQAVQKPIEASQPCFIARIDSNLTSIWRLCPPLMRKDSHKEENTPLRPACAFISYGSSSANGMKQTSSICI